MPWWTHNSIIAMCYNCHWKPPRSFGLSKIWQHGQWVGCLLLTYHHYFVSYTFYQFASWGNSRCWLSPTKLWHRTRLSKGLLYSNYFCLSSDVRVGGFWVPLIKHGHLMGPRKHILSFRMPAVMVCRKHFGRLRLCYLLSNHSPGSIS